MATATATAPFLVFGAQAVEMERYAVRQLERSETSRQERDMANALLRHARGITSLAEKWRNLND